MESMIGTPNPQIEVASDVGQLPVVSAADVRSAARLQRLLYSWRLGSDNLIARVWILAGYGFWPGAVVAGIMHQHLNVIYLAALGVSSEIVRQLRVQQRGTRLAADTADVDLGWLRALVELEPAAVGEVQLACRIRLIRALGSLNHDNRSVLDAATDVRLRRHLRLLPALKHAQFAVAILNSYAAMKHPGARAEAQDLLTASPRPRVHAAAKNYLQALEEAGMEPDLEPDEVPDIPELAVVIAKQTDIAPTGGDGMPTVNPLRKTGKFGVRRQVFMMALAVMTPTGVVYAVQDALKRQYWGVAANVVLALTPFALSLLAANNRQLRKLRELSQSDNLDAIPPLTEALDSLESEAVKVALSGLTRLLPAMRPSDALLLSSKHRVILYRYLDIGLADEYEEFIQAVLKALAQIGDQSAVRPVERLTTDTTYTPAQKRVQAGALACLQMLPLTADHTEHITTLLRAATSDAPAEVLLRPSRNVSENANLLRSTDESAL